MRALPWSLASAALAATIAAACVQATATEPPEPTRVEIAGTVRWQSPTSWAAVVDAEHVQVGMAQVQLLADRVRIVYAQPASAVLTCSADADESFTAAGVRVGASVATTHADLLFYMGTSSTPVNPALLTRAGANVWVHCTHPSA